MCTSVNHLYKNQVILQLTAIFLNTTFMSSSNIKSPLMNNPYSVKEKTLTVYCMYETGTKTCDNPITRIFPVASENSYLNTHNQGMICWVGIKFVNRMTGNYYPLHYTSVFGLTNEKTKYRN